MTVRKYVAAGMPVDSIAAAVKWLRAHDLTVRRSQTPDLSDERARLTRAKAVALERDNRVAAGELVEASDVGRFLENAFVIARQKLLGLPAKLAVEIAATTSPAEVQSILRGAITEALESLADLDWGREMRRAYAHQGEPDPEPEAA
ncbi:MAG TPA: hypothetical protein VK714_10155 [Myxococcota bacterium]|nr:hypothetical protein [Myxococcota bacterium]